jgi:hypothetical protein
MSRRLKPAVAETGTAFRSAMPAIGCSPEQLVGIGFRCWLAGYETGEIACWEQAWTAYADVLGNADAKRALGDLSCWVRAIRGWAQRPIKTYPPGCQGFCQDECIAISMIASCQHNVCPAMRACAFTLLGCPMIDEVVQGAESFAATLRSVSQVLSPHSICSVAHVPAPQGTLPH